MGSGRVLEGFWKGAGRVLEGYSEGFWKGTDASSTWIIMKGGLCMTIKEFAEKYNLEKRTVDYFTTIGIFHPKEAKSENTTFKVYRDYDKRCERERLKL